MDIVLVIVSFVIGIVVIRLGIDYSNNTKYNRQILQELREIKQHLKERDSELR
ncbi:hypothetical protein M3231_10775 [Neobacillus mesonae]|nr:hypothetical protein [Neobacillus mesonae]